MKKYLGFTLAEVLIALVITGVVAAITLPVLWANYTEQERISKVKKNYSMLANAMTKVKAAGGDLEFEFIDNNTENMEEWFNKYLKNNLVVTKVCYNTSGCWNSGDTRYINGSLADQNRTGICVGDNCVTAVLNDGTFISINTWNNAYYNFGINAGSSEIVMGLLFDINGEKEPNTFGKDVFVTVYTEDGFVPAFQDRTKADKETDCSSGTGKACIHKYLNK